MKKVLVIYGGIGSGKSTATKLIYEICTANKNTSKILHAFHDVYKPYLASIGIDVPDDIDRTEIANLISKIYSQHGEEFGTRLFIDSLSRFDEDVIILDGKRNLTGLRLIKEQLKDDCHIIGIESSKELRVARIGSRLKDLDKNLDPEEMIEEEEKKYSMVHGLHLCDHVIRNDGTLNELTNTLQIVVSQIETQRKLPTYARTLSNKLSTLNESLVNSEWTKEFSNKYAELIETDSSNEYGKIHEIELKACLSAENEQKITRFVTESNSELPKPELEDDIVLDTLFDDLKKRGIVLRIRYKKNSGVLFTLKVKNTDSIAKHDFEIEHLLGSAPKTQELVNDFLTACGLPKFNFTLANDIAGRAQNLEPFEQNVSQLGYEKIRMRLQKMRSEIKLTDLGTLCIDTLPFATTKYLEIETNSLASMNQMREILNMSDFLSPKIDYGEIAKEINVMRGVQDIRSLVFPVTGLQITTPARIHMGLIDCGNTTQRLFGGLGFSLDGLHLKLKASIGTRWSINYSSFIIDERTQSQVNIVFESLESRYVHIAPVTYALTEMPPQHCGLGSKTSLLLSIVKLALSINNIPHTDQEVIQLSGRGGTSGIGINTFFSGGIITDSGHMEEGTRDFAPSSYRSRKAQKPKVISRITPANLKIAVFADLKNEKMRIQGLKEVEIFKKNMPMQDIEVYKTLALVYHGVLPAFQENDMHTLFVSIKNLHLSNLKKVEFSLQSNDTIAFLQKLWEKEVPAGVSSFGPSIYAFGTDEELNILKSMAYQQNIDTLGIFDLDITGAKLTKLID